MKKFDGINIQYPISKLIVEGTKTIETRTYQIPKKYLNKEILLIETPGPEGKFKSRAVAIIKFTNCFKYKNKKHFYQESHLHCVTPDSSWAWKEKDKWGWEVEIVKVLSQPVEIKKHGIVYRTEIPIPMSVL